MPILFLMGTYKQLCSFNPNVSGHIKLCLSQKLGQILESGHKCLLIHHSKVVVFVKLALCRKDILFYTSYDTTNVQLFFVTNSSKQTHLLYHK
jgi:hypothetical protein